MMPSSLVGKKFCVPVMNAKEQRYKVTEVISSGVQYILKLEAVKEFVYLVPDELKLKLTFKVTTGNQKLVDIHLFEDSDSSPLVHRHGRVMIPRARISTITKFGKEIEKMAIDYLK